MRIQKSLSLCCFLVDNQGSLVRLFEALRFNDGLLTYNSPGKGFQASFIWVLRELKLGLVFFVNCLHRQGSGFIQLLFSRIDDLLGATFRRRRLLLVRLILLLDNILLGVFPIGAVSFLHKLLFRLV